MNAEKDCVFCRIARGTIPAEKLYEDGHVVAFRDLNPQAPLHALIIPRRHMESLSLLAPGDLPVLEHVQKAILHLAESLPAGAADYRLVVNCGRSAGQSVFHLHYHFLAGRDFTWPPG